MPFNACFSICPTVLRIAENTIFYGCIIPCSLLGVCGFYRIDIWITKYVANDNIYIPIIKKVEKKVFFCTVAYLNLDELSWIRINFVKKPRI